MPMPFGVVWSKRPPRVCQSGPCPPGRRPAGRPPPRGGSAPSPKASALRVTQPHRRQRPAHRPDGDSACPLPIQQHAARRCPPRRRAAHTTRPGACPLREVAEAARRQRGQRHAACSSNRLVRPRRPSGRRGFGTVAGLAGRGAPVAPPTRQTCRSSDLGSRPRPAPTAPHDRQAAPAPLQLPQRSGLPTGVYQSHPPRNPTHHPSTQPPRCRPALPSNAGPTATERRRKRHTLTAPAPTALGHADRTSTGGLPSPQPGSNATRSASVTHRSATAKRQTVARPPSPTRRAVAHAPPSHRRPPPQAADGLGLRMVVMPPDGGWRLTLPRGGGLASPSAPTLAPNLRGPVPRTEAAGRRR